MFFMPRPDTYAFNARASAPAQSSRPAKAVASSCTGRRWHLSLILFVVAPVRQCLEMPSAMSTKDLMTEQSLRWGVPRERKSRLRPNVNTYGVVLSACASGAARVDHVPVAGALWQAAISYLQAASRGASRSLELSQTAGGVADATTYASTAILRGGQTWGSTEVDACESGNQAIQVRGPCESLDSDSKAPDFMEALTLKSLDSLQSVATTAI